MNFYPYCSHLLSDLREILYTRSERDAVQHYEFSENRYSENHTSLKGTHEILYTRSERDAVQHYEISENRYSENHTSLKGTHEILSLHTTFFVRVRYNSTQVNKKRCVRISWKSHREGCFTEGRK